jgi:hypothetical protein
MFWRRTTGSSPTGQEIGHVFICLIAPGEATEALSGHREPSGALVISLLVFLIDHAEDLTSEVFLKVVEGVGRLGQKMGFAAWFFRSRALSSLVIIVSARNSQCLFLC